MIGPWVALISTFVGFLVAAAIVSRLASDKQVPGIVGKLADAMANIFRGVFHG